jgi:hypothetical protein
MTNLFEKAVNITVISTEATIFDSVRVFISTIDGNDINIFKEYKVEGIENESEKMHLLPITIYRFRRNIEVIFYEHKFFWSFGNYMVCNKNVIERYTHLLAVGFTFVNVLPFINNNYSSYKFQSPQIIKHGISAQLNKELILGTFVSRLGNTKIYTISILKYVEDAMIQQQQTISLSPFVSIYDLVVPKDNLLHRINELIDLSFIEDELLDKYCIDNGRKAISPIRMFKYLLLKSIFDLSDVDIVERSKYDMSFKYFLDMAPGDTDVRIRHKTADSSFFGYKTHIAMTEERIITATTITTGEKNDGKQLETLISKSIETGIEVDTIIGDSAYSEKGNIECANSHGMKLVAKLNPSVTQGFRKKEDEFEFNKDAGMYACKADIWLHAKLVKGKSMYLQIKHIYIILM